MRVSGRRFPEDYFRFISFSIKLFVEAPPRAQTESESRRAWPILLCAWRPLTGDAATPAWPSSRTVPIGATPTVEGCLSTRFALFAGYVEAWHGEPPHGIHADITDRSAWTT